MDVQVGHGVAEGLGFIFTDRYLPLGLAAIQAVFAIMVDKPLVLTAAEGRAPAHRGARTQGAVDGFHNCRWDDDLHTLQRLLAARALGRAHRFESRFERWRPAAARGLARAGAPGAGGDRLLDLSRNLMDQAVLLFGQPRSVFAEVDRRRVGVEGDDDVFIALEQAGGCAGSRGPAHSPRRSGRACGCSARAVPMGCL